jgi:hypothetical protein
LRRMPRIYCTTVLLVDFVRGHPSLLGATLGVAIIGSAVLISKYVPSFGDEHKPRDKHLPWLRDAGGLIYFFALFPVIATQHRSDTVTNYQRHFEYVSLLIAFGMVLLSLIIGCVWWVLAEVLVAREKGRTDRE